MNSTISNRWKEFSKNREEQILKKIEIIYTELGKSQTDIIEKVFSEDIIYHHFGNPPLIGKQQFLDWMKEVYREFDISILERKLRSYKIRRASLSRNVCVS